MNPRDPQTLSAVIGSVIGGLARPDNLDVLRTVVREWATSDNIWVALQNVATHNQQLENLAINNLNQGKVRKP